MLQGYGHYPGVPSRGDCKCDAALGPRGRKAREQVLSCPLPWRAPAGEKRALGRSRRGPCGGRSFLGLRAMPSPPCGLMAPRGGCQVTLLSAVLRVAPCPLRLGARRWTRPALCSRPPHTQRPDGKNASPHGRRLSVSAARAESRRPRPRAPAPGATSHGATRPATSGNPSCCLSASTCLRRAGGGVGGGPAGRRGGRAGGGPRRPGRARTHTHCLLRAGFPGSAPRVPGPGLLSAPGPSPSTPRPRGRAVPDVGSAASPDRRAPAHGPSRGR